MYSEMLTNLGCISLFDIRLCLKFFIVCFSVDRT